MQGSVESSPPAPRRFFRRGAAGYIGEIRHGRRKRQFRPGAIATYKGPLYEVIGVARHSETEEELVVYRALYGDGGLWVLPKKMFLGNDNCCRP